CRRAWPSLRIVPLQTVRAELVEAPSVHPEPVEGCLECAQRLRQAPPALRQAQGERVAGGGAQSMIARAFSSSSSLAVSPCASLAMSSWYLSSTPSVSCTVSGS